MGRDLGQQGYRFIDGLRRMVLEGSRLHHGPRSSVTAPKRSTNAEMNGGRSHSHVRGFFRVIHAFSAM
jgi:hypothetical protein